ncbi:hypothetical protein BACPU_06470 [Bacillus pumilus]|nr:hypothetical protein BACPU_06470 [Bacillus pumilus]
MFESVMIKFGRENVEKMKRNDDSILIIETA